MHEISLMQGVVKTILQALSPSGTSRVTRVQLTIGVSGHLNQVNVQQHFRLLTKGTPAEGASLRISWLPATLQCLACSHRFSSYDPAEQETCPQCGDIVMETEHQDICYVNAIDVVTEED
jgi:hydrogenase nickel incorporation protein HypA/HybF